MTREPQRMGVGVELAIIFAVFVPAVLAVVLTIVLSRRRAESAEGDESHSIPFIGGLLGSLFVVVVTFYLVLSWQNFNEVEARAKAEADALLGAYWQAEIFSDPAQQELQQLVREYASVVVASEWSAPSGPGRDSRVRRILDDLRAEFVALPADDPKSRLARKKALRYVQRIADNHRARVDLINGDNWFIFTLLCAQVVGAVLMVAFPLLAGFGGNAMNIAVMSLLGISVGAVVLLSVELLSPTQGIFKVDPEPFTNVLKIVGRKG